MTPAYSNSPTIFETTPIAPDDPLLQRPVSSLPLEAIANAARIVTAYPTVEAIQKYRRHVVSLRLTPEEYDELALLRATIRAGEIVHAPPGLHSS